MKRKCPKCGSKDYTRSKNVVLTIIHREGKAFRRIEHDGICKWWFGCLKCEYLEEQL